MSDSTQPPTGSAPPAGAFQADPPPLPPPDRRGHYVILAVVVLFLAGAGVAAWQLFERPVEGEVLYNDEKFRSTDPALIRYRETGKIAAGFNKPRGIALAADGTLYIAGDKSVAVVGADGRRKADWPCAGEAVAVAVARDHTLYVAIHSPNAKDQPRLPDRIQVFTGGKAGEPWRPATDKSWITSIAVHPEGDVYIADFGERAVWRYREGKNFSRLGGEGAKTLNIPSPHVDVQVAPDGLVWVVNSGEWRLEAYDREDRKVKSWGTRSFAIEGFSGCCNPADFAILPDGRFITSEKGLPRVKRYSAEGHFECVVAPTEAMPNPGLKPIGFDVVAAADGRVYVLDPIARAVRIFSEVKP